MDLNHGNPSAFSQLIPPNMCVSSNKHIDSPHEDFNIAYGNFDSTNGCDASMGYMQSPDQEHTFQAPCFFEASSPNNMEQMVKREALSPNRFKPASEPSNHVPVSLYGLLSSVGYQGQALPECQGLASSWNASPKPHSGEHPTFELTRCGSYPVAMTVEEEEAEISKQAELMQAHFEHQRRFSMPLVSWNPSGKAGFHWQQDCLPQEHSMDSLHNHIENRIPHDVCEAHSKFSPNIKGRSPPTQMHPPHTMNVNPAHAGMRTLPNLQFSGKQPLQKNRTLPNDGKTMFM